MNLVTKEALSVFKEKIINAVLGSNSGEFNSVLVYNEKDIVYYNNKIYVCKQSCSGKLPTDTDYWGLLVETTSVINSALMTEDTILTSIEGYGLVAKGE